MTALLELRPVLVVLPRLSDGRIILLHRSGEPTAADAGRWELPTCALPQCGADLHAVAADLLHRTTDYVPNRLIALGRFAALASAHCYLAEGLRPSERMPVDAGRAMTTAVHPAELRQLIRCGAVRCGKLLGALTMLEAHETTHQERWVL